MSDVNEGEKESVKLMKSNEKSLAEENEESEEVNNDRNDHENTHGNVTGSQMSESGSASESDGSETTEVRPKETDKHGSGEMVVKEKKTAKSLLMIAETPLR